MADNYGLLGTMASGIREGLLAYQTTQQMKRQNQMQNLLQGTQEDDQGNLGFTPEMQAQREAQQQGILAKSKRDADALDRNSEASQRASGLLTSQGIKLPAGGLSASEATTYQPLFKEQIHNQGTQGVADTKAESAEEVANLKAQNAKLKGESVGNKDWSKFSDAMDPNKARGGNLAKSQAMINASDRVDALFRQFPDNNIPKAQTTELTTAVAAMVNGGSAQSQHQIDSMVPSSARGSAQDIASWITNEPTGRQQQAFMKMLRETSSRERDVATSQVRQAQAGRLQQFDYLNKNNPQKYRGILQGYGFDPNDIDDSGKYAPKAKATGAGLLNAPAVAHPQADAALKWAKENPNDPDAQLIMKRLGQ